MISSARAPLADILGHLRAEPSRTWSVIVTVYGDAIIPRGGSVWLGTLTEFFAALDIGSGVVRTAMSRLAADGWLERTRIGRNSFYALSASGRQTFRQATEHIYAASPLPWNGRFTMLLLGSPPEREEARSALAAAGFGSAAPGVWTAPAGTVVPQEAAGAIQLDATCDLDAARRVAARCWPLDRMADAYARFAAAFAPLGTALESGVSIADIDAFTARILLVHEFRRIVLRDPVLPPELLPSQWPGMEARRLCARLYHRLLPASEHWLDGHGQCATGPLPPAGPELWERFGGKR